MKKLHLNWVSVVALIVSLTVLSCGERTDELVNGYEAPNITLPDKNGNEISLTDLRGNIVLVDFWASWCKSCRKEHPKYVALYNQYRTAQYKNATGFEVYCVSLDQKEPSWLKAIKRDRLNFAVHVSELNGFNSSAAAAYNIQDVPSNYLLDHRGIIIGKNVSPKQLELVLKKRRKAG